MRILLLAALLAVLSTLASVQLLKATSRILGDEELPGECIGDVRSSLRDSLEFLKSAGEAAWRLKEIKAIGRNG